MSTSATESDDSKREDLDTVGVSEGKEVSPLPVLVVNLEDFPPEVRGKAVARSEGRRAYGGDNSQLLTTLYDALPGVIAKRLQRITPPDFRLSEIELELALDVALPGVEIGGTVKVTLKPAGSSVKEEGR